MLGIKFRVKNLWLYDLGLRLALGLELLLGLGGG